MTRHLTVTILSFLLAAVCIYGGNTADIVPQPEDMKTGKGKFVFSDKTIVSVQNDEQEAVATYLCGLFTDAAGFTPAIVENSAGKKADVLFLEDSTVGSEAYRLDISRTRVEISASDAPGFFYAVQTLRMLLPPEIESQGAAGTEWAVPAGKIEDSPKFHYRGLMLDVSRHFIPKDDVKQIIDCMAMLKLNTLHWHLTDDNGWRLEIRKYPRLTSVGAWRVDREDIPFPSRRNQRTGEPADAGGFYTQDEIREVVAYAAERQIQIIPEIDMPAHANAALASYPEYACPVAPRPISVFPGMGEGRWDVILCAGNENTYSFIEDILDEVMELFPSKYIHIGGDEAQKTIWKKCPLCQERMHREGIADEEHLQGYFMGRIASYLKEKGRTAVGWDELVKSDLPEGAVICGWQGDGRSAFKAAALGHRFIMTPAKVMYFIRYQGPQWFEPLTYFGNITLKDVYEYDYTANQGWKPEYSDLMMGLQACMWTEFCRNTEDVTYLLFPRLAALSEIVWTGDGKRSWEGFLPGLDSFLAHLDAKGTVYSRSMYNIQHTSTPADGALSIALDCIRPDVEIRYTTDGSDPASDSGLYSGPVSIDSTCTLKCATFFNDGTMAGKILELPVKWNMATGKNVTSSGNAAGLLTNGIRGSLRESDFEWCTWMSGQPAEIVLDLGSSTGFTAVKIGCLTNYGMGVHKPAYIEIEISDDGQNYTPAARRDFYPAEIFREGNFVEDIIFTLPQAKARYIRISAEGPGLNLADHVRPGQVSKFCLDEITVE